MSDISTTSLPPVAKPRKGRQVLKWIAIVIGSLLLLILAALGVMIYRMNYVPAELNTATELLSDAGLYRVSYTPQAGLISVNQIHSWILHIETADGQPVENAQVSVNGDMPQHGHGLPTRPQVTEYLGNGDYRVEGMKFHMPGWWIAVFEINANGQSDQVTFNFILEK